MKRKYELMFTVDALLDDAQVDEVANRIRAVIESREGEILDWNRWGKRRFAYEIKGRTHGVYFVVTYLLAPNFINEIENALKLTESVLRHLNLVISERMEKLMARQYALREKLSQQVSERAAKAEGAMSDLTGERPQNLDEAEAIAEKLSAEAEK